MPVTPAITLPPAPHDVALEAIVGFLRRDPLLQRYVKTWQYWAGNATDGDAAVPESCPFLRITATPTGQVRRFDNTTHLMPMFLIFELAVPGSTPTAITRFWAQIQRVLFPTNPTAAATFDAAMLAVGVSELTIQVAPTGLPYTPSPAGPAQTDWVMVHGMARVLVDVYVQTQPTPS